MKKKDTRVFDYSIELEMAFTTVLGEKSVYNHAGNYDNPKYVKKDFLKLLRDVLEIIVVVL